MGGVYHRIYAYEITPDTYQMLVKNVAEYPNIIPINKGVSDTTGIQYVNNIANHAGNKLQEYGEIAIEVVTLDESIKEPVDIIKMDIEGAEKSAIRGARRHIEMDKSKLLISAYHLPEDIFEIPELIYNIRDDYHFYLRFNGYGCLWPCDYVLFAV